MIISTETHKGHDYTAAVMYQMIRNFAEDLGDLAYLDWNTYFDLVRGIRYQNDADLTGSPFHEVVSRPWHILYSEIFLGGLDCKKKAILICAYAHRNGIPYRLIGAIENGGREVHHVFPLVFENGEWKNADATFPEYRYASPKPELTYAEVLQP